MTSCWPRQNDKLALREWWSTRPSLRRLWRTIRAAGGVATLPCACPTSIAPVRRHGGLEWPIRRAAYCTLLRRAVARA